MSTPAASARLICATVPATSVVSVLVMVCTDDRRAVAHRDLADIDPARLAPDDFLVGPIAHASLLDRGARAPAVRAIRFGQTRYSARSMGSSAGLRYW